MHAQITTCCRILICPVVDQKDDVIDEDSHSTCSEVSKAGVLNPVAKTSCFNDISSVAPMRVRPWARHFARQFGDDATLDKSLGSYFVTVWSWTRHLILKGAQYSISNDGLRSPTLGKPALGMP